MLLSEQRKQQNEEATYGMGENTSKPSAYEGEHPKYIKNSNNTATIIIIIKN